LKTGVFESHRQRHRNCRHQPRSLHPLPIWFRPSFGAAVQYAPFKHTQISLSASQSVARRCSKTKSRNHQLRRQPEPAAPEKIPAQSGRRLQHCPYTRRWRIYVRSRDNYYYFNARLTIRCSSAALRGVLSYSDINHRTGLRLQSSQIGFEFLTLLKLADAGNFSGALEDDHA